MNNKPPIVKINIGDKDYSLTPKLENVMKIEDFFDMSIPQLGNRLTEGKLKTIELATCLFYMIDDKNFKNINELGQEVVGNYAKYANDVGNYLIASMSGADQELEELTEVNNEKPSGGTEGN